MMINIFFDPRCDSLGQKDQSWWGNVLPKPCGEFCPQYWPHCGWDKISLEGSDDLHSKDETVGQQKHSAVIPQLSGAHVLQPRCNTEKTLSVSLCGGCIWVQAYPPPPTQAFYLRSCLPSHDQRRSPLGDQLHAALAWADARPAVNTDFTWQLIDNWMSYGCWTRTGMWENWLIHTWLSVVINQQPSTILVSRGIMFFFSNQTSKISHLFLDSPYLLWPERRLHK